ncbi:MAG: protein kinase [Acidobacteria bacterium]|nr:protein kinase [Acidobacteriota bacterium]MBV9186319.1 protein kinase [Acidobacteriota bacterium]
MDKLIAQAPTNTPAALKSSPWKSRAMPDDLLKQASGRLGILALLAAALWVLGTALDRVALRVMSHGNPNVFTSPLTDGIAEASAVLSLALFFYVRKSKRNPRFILDLGLAYLVVTAFALGVLFHWEHVPSAWPVSPMISWIGVVVLMFTAIVPSTPMKTLIAGFIAVSMNPIGMLIARARGAWDFGATSNVLLMHYPDYLLVGAAVVIAHVLTNLGRQVAKAREMGSYRLGALLGKGGMGEVYEATHHMLARPAAIKLIRPEMIRAESGERAHVAIQRFRREAEAAANLRSPHTVELYDFGVTGDQTMYFVMELLDGMDLQSLVRQYGALPANRTIYILRQVCASLEEAHMSGLVHRDIKPANIHVGRLGLQYDFVKVLDFGLVKSIASANADYSLATEAGITPGTPAYMSPEMALGEPIDGRADIYALGCVAYYLLTGTLVFEAENIFQLMAKRLRDDPVPPSQRTSLSIPPALDRLVLACLERKPENRLSSAAEVARLLSEIDVPPWDESQAADWWQAHRPAHPTMDQQARLNPRPDDETIVMPDSLHELLAEDARKETLA